MESSRIENGPVEQDSEQHSGAGQQNVAKQKMTNLTMTQKTNGIGMQMGTADTLHKFAAGLTTSPGCFDKNKYHNIYLTKTYESP